MQNRGKYKRKCYVITGQSLSYLINTIFLIIPLYWNLFVGRAVIPQIENLKHQTDQISNWTYHENYDKMTNATENVCGAEGTKKNCELGHFQTWPRPSLGTFCGTRPAYWPLFFRIVVVPTVVQYRRRSLRVIFVHLLLLYIYFLCFYFIFRSMISSLL